MKEENTNDRQKLKKKKETKKKRSKHQRVHFTSYVVSGWLKW